MLLSEAVNQVKLLGGTFDTRRDSGLLFHSQIYASVFIRESVLVFSVILKHCFIGVWGWSEYYYGYTQPSH